MGWQVVDELSSKSLLSKGTQKFVKGRPKVAKQAKVARTFCDCQDWQVEASLGT